MLAKHLYIYYYYMRIMILCVQQQLPDVVMTGLWDKNK